jgi:hypothetical protein
LAQPAATAEGEPPPFVLESFDMTNKATPANNGLSGSKTGTAKVGAANSAEKRKLPKWVGGKRGPGVNKAAASKERVGCQKGASPFFALSACVSN